MRSRINDLLKDVLLQEYGLHHVLMPEIHLMMLRIECFEMDDIMQCHLHNPALRNQTF